MGKVINMSDKVLSSKVINMGGVEWVGRTRRANPENQAIRDKAESLKVGQGFKVPKVMVISKKIKASNGQIYTLRTYKGYNLVRKIEGRKFSTRRDASGNMYLFRAA